MNAKIKNIISGAISICIFSELLYCKKEVEIDIDGIIEGMDAMLQNASEKEEYEFCGLIIKAKQYVQTPEFNLDEFLDDIKKEDKEIE